MNYQDQNEKIKSLQVNCLDTIAKIEAVQPKVEEINLNLNDIGTGVKLILQNRNYSIIDNLNSIFWSKITRLGINYFTDEQKIIIEGNSELSNGKKQAFWEDNSLILTKDNCQNYIDWLFNSVVKTLKRGATFDKQIIKESNYNSIPSKLKLLGISFNDYSLETFSKTNFIANLERLFLIKENLESTNKNLSAYRAKEAIRECLKSGKKLESKFNCKYFTLKIFKNGHCEIDFKKKYLDFLNGDSKELLQSEPTKTNDTNLNSDKISVPNKNAPIYITYNFENGAVISGNTYLAKEIINQKPSYFKFCKIQKGKNKGLCFWYIPGTRKKEEFNQDTVKILFKMKNKLESDGFAVIYNAPEIEEEESRNIDLIYNKYEEGNFQNELLL